jgi:hypothetical protein
MIHPDARNVAHVTEKWYNAVRKWKMLGHQQAGGGTTMDNRDRCPRCGALLLQGEKFCGQCGAPLTDTADAAGTVGVGVGAGVGGNSGWQPGMRPCTIAQLKDFCAYHGMPLERMRFFVGEDYQQARAFGIFQDGDRFVVYKNKDDGSRAVRYNGPDEAFAVGELYDKLLDECHKRDIWPDGKPADYEKRMKSEKRRMVAIAMVVVMLMGIVGFIFLKIQAREHANDGYYRFNDAGIYYCYGGDWFYDDGYYDWVPVTYGPYDDYDDWSGYYIGDTYDRS